MSLAKFSLAACLLTAGVVEVTATVVSAQDAGGPLFRTASLNAPRPVAHRQDQEAEARIMDALRTPIDADYGNSPAFPQVLNDLEAQTGIPIILDWKTTGNLRYRIFAETYFVTETPIALSAQNIPLRSVLDLLLPPMGLAWGIKDESIQITTPEVAATWLTEQIYTFEQILAQNPSLANDPRAAAQTVGDYITSFVEPNVWRLNGGNSEIVHLDGAILVRATRSVQEQVQAFLDQWSSLKTGENVSPAELEIADVLAENFTLNTPELPLQEALPLISDETQVPIFLDYYTLLDERLSFEHQHGLDVSGISLGAVLGLMLEPHGMAAVIHDDVLLITSQPRANDLMDVRLYDVRDLLVPGGENESPPMDSRTLTSILDTTVAPASWFSAGGDARKELYVSEGSQHVMLFVRQSAAGHQALQERLDQLKQWRSTRRVLPVSTD